MEDYLTYDTANLSASVLEYPSNFTSTWQSGIPYFTTVDQVSLDIQNPSLSCVVPGPGPLDMNGLTNFTEVAAFNQPYTHQVFETANCLGSVMSTSISVSPSSPHITFNDLTKSIYIADPLGILDTYFNVTFTTILVGIDPVAFPSTTSTTSLFNLHFTGACEHGDSFYFEGLCVVACSVGQYINPSNNQCDQCMDDCEVCADEHTCYSCVNTVLYDGYCVASCPAGTYQMVGGCQSCPYGCSTCEGPEY